MGSFKALLLIGNGQMDRVTREESQDSDGCSVAVEQQLDGTLEAVAPQRLDEEQTTDDVRPGDVVDVDLAADGRHGVRHQREAHNAE